jgi:hypothetical protein
MSGPVPSPSMKGMIGWSGTFNLPPLIVIASPPLFMGTPTQKDSRVNCRRAAIMDIGEENGTADA